MWDAENRLIGFEPQEPVEGSLKVAFKYDYLGRRVAKAVYPWDKEDPNDPNDGCWEATPKLHRRFVWYNWLLLEELDVDASGAVTGVAKKYTWGLDLAGLWGGQTSGLSSLEGAGGIGGLLAVHDPEDDPTPDKNYVFFYDANGSVGQLIDWENDGTLVAKYEYDPYGGNLLDPTDPQESGPYAGENPIRFSTKYFDAETALGYWGYRYYSPRLGRWLKRDPIGEQGGPNLYELVRNCPSALHDPLGLQPDGGKATSRPSNQALSERLCPAAAGWEVVDGGDIASSVEVRPWSRAGFEDAPGDRVFLLWARTKKTWKVPPGARRIRAGCGGKLTGSWTFTKSEARTFSVGSSFKVTLWKVLEVGLSAGGSQTGGTSVGTTVGTGEWGGPGQCYEWQAYALAEWEDVYSFKDLVDPYGPTVPPGDPIGGGLFMGSHVGAGWTGDVSKIVCRRNCCDDVEAASK